MKQKRRRDEGEGMTRGRDEGGDVMKKQMRGRDDGDLTRGPDVGRDSDSPGHGASRKGPGAGGAGREGRDGEGDARDMRGATE